VTLIAGFDVNRIPFILGDILLSGPEMSGEPPLRIPTIGDRRAIFPMGATNDVPVGLSQKIFIPSQNAAIGFAGNSRYIRSVVHDIKELVRDGKLHFSDVERLLMKFDKDANYQDYRFGVSLYGLIDDGGIRSFCFGCRREGTSETFGLVKLLGSGDAHMERLLKAFGGGLPDAASEGEQAASAALTAAARLLDMELRTADSIRSYYGGGYELAYFDTDRFRKLEDVAYYIWTVSPNHPTGTVNLGLSSILRVGYEDRDMIIQTFSARNGGSYGYHAIPPLDRDDARMHSGTPNLDASFVCHYFRAPAPNNQEDIISLVQHAPDPQSLWVSAFLDRQCMRLELKEPFWSFVQSNFLYPGSDSQ
jgi:hypothetical protein